MEEFTQIKAVRLAAQLLLVTMLRMCLESGLQSWPRLASWIAGIAQQAV
jgi:hypothetical protein